MVGGLLLAVTAYTAPTLRVGAATTIDRPTTGPVVAVLADVRVAGQVFGDVVAVGGDVVLAESAVVDGDVVALGGSVRGRAAVTGRTVAFGGTVESRDHRGVQALGLALVRLGGWVLVAWTLLRIWPKAVRTLAGTVEARVIRVAVAGAMTILACVALFAVALALLGSPLGGPVVALAAGWFVAIKVLGVVALGLEFGRLVLRRFVSTPADDIVAACAAVAVLVAASFVPVAGELAWQVVGVTAIGVVVAAVFDRLRTNPLIVGLLAR